MGWGRNVKCVLWECYPYSISLCSRSLCIQEMQTVISYISKISCLLSPRKAVVTLKKKKGMELKRGKLWKEPGKVKREEKRPRREARDG